jgi:hypothetical protein
MPLSRDKASAIATTYGLSCRINPSRVKKIAQAGQSACLTEIESGAMKADEHAPKLL